MQRLSRGVAEVEEDDEVYRGKGGLMNWGKMKALVRRIYIWVKIINKPKVIYISKAGYSVAQSSFAYLAQHWL